MRTILLALMLGLGLLSFNEVAFSQQVAKTIPNATSPDGLIGFLEFRPSDYGSQKHPLIIFLHGIGERGNGTSQIPMVAYNAIPLLCANGASMRFTVGGQTSSFVVLSPQLSLGYAYWPTFYVKEMINYAKANLQIDPNRIYVTGLSLGGGGIWRVITEAINGDYTYDAGIAAAAPVCGTQEESDYDFCNTIGNNHLPVWAFHSMDDNTVNVATTQHAESLALNCGLSPAAKFTYYQSGDHAGAWINAFDTGHITTAVNGGGYFTATPNLYEWFLSNKRNSTTPSYTAPVANAGIAQSITLPLSTVTLTGTGTGTNGATIVSYAWTKASGPAGAAISLPLTSTTLITGLTAGTYVFTLTVTDNHGLSGSSNVVVTVSPVINQAPVSKAGNNTAITLPVNTIAVDGSASYDPDGSIAAYYWTKISGPSSYTIADPTAVKTTLSNLAQGAYEFQLQVRDNGGVMGYSSVFITVNPAPATPTPPPGTPNQAPVSNAGPDVTVPLPTNKISLDGSTSYDPDGTIVAWYWVQISGPSAATIDDASLIKPSLSNLVQGVYVFQLQVRDNGGTIGYSGKKITMDQPPVAKPGPDVSISLPANSFSLDGSASYDTDGTIVAWYWIQTSGPSSSVIANPGGVTTTVSNLVQGVYTFQLQVRDDAGVVSYSSKTITVNPSSSTNQTPVANAGGDVTITLPTNSASFDASASYDPDGTINAYYWVQTSGPSSSYIANVSAVKTTVSGLIQGVYTFQLQVRDNAGVIGYGTKAITVNAAVPGNTPPVANAGANATITLPVNTVPVDGSASYDPDGTIAAYTWTQTGGPSTATITNASAAKATISALVQGIYTFQLQVKDNAGATSNATKTVTVNAAAPGNVTPVSNAGGNVTINLPTNSLVVDASASYDPDGSIVAYYWVQITGPAPSTIANPSGITTTISGLVQGVYNFQLQVRDDAGVIGYSGKTITVNAAGNQTPIANAGSNITITLPTSSTTLNGSASSDPDGTISTYAWTKTSGPATYTIANAAAATTALTGLVQGVYVFTLQVTDNAGATASATVTVTVNAAGNQPPVANAGSNITITLPTNSTTLNGSASSDADGTISTYAWTKTSGPATYTIASAAAATTALTGLVQGVYIFTLQVKDNAGATASATVTVTVNPAGNQPPIANAGSNISITLPTSSTTLNGSASSDADGTISTYAWTKTSGPATYTIANAAGATSALTGLVQGVYVFTLQVTDNAGATASSTVTVTVNAAANQPPVANAGSNISITLPTSSTTLNGSASSDPDGTIATYAWTKTSGPATFTIANAAGATTALTGLVQGVYVFTLQVKDNAGATASATVTVTVNAANQPPVANAGSNITITLPTSSTTLNGSASSDADGTISTYAWTKTSGPATYTIANAAAATTALTGLAQGVYVFTLQVKDNAGATASATVTVTVNAAPNQPPVANAGSNITITLPATTSTTLNGSASSDADGTIATYAWTKTSGPATYTIANAATATTTLTGLVQGVYVFTLQVKDNAGATASATVTVTVNATSNFIGYIKTASGSTAACDDASTTGRTAVYGTGISNGKYVYTDAALSKKLTSLWSWISFTPALGGQTTYAFIISPLGSISSLQACASGARLASEVLATTPAQDQAQATLKAQKDSAAMAFSGTNLIMYPNPVHTTATIVLYSADNSVKTINVYYSNGILKAKYTWQTVKGNNTFPLTNIAGLANGLYIIDIRDSDGKQNGKLKFIKM